ncbi:MAG: hypothetical protein K6G83_07390 [Lachnospiraceae bacterium]|nr:hypothetical protein [Lachnospiraceae bacterium]
MKKLIRSVNRKEGSVRMKRASVTIEAALLFPLILGSVVFVIFMAFYRHDCVLSLKACLSATVRAEKQETEEKAYAEAEAAVDEIMEEKLTGLWEYEKKLLLSGEEVEISLQGSMRYFGGFFGLLSLPGQSGTSSMHLSQNICCFGKRISPAGTLRRIKAEVRTLESQDAQDRRIRY